MPSTVVTDAPSHIIKGYMHALTVCVTTTPPPSLRPPSSDGVSQQRDSMTVHAPHWPTPHPNLVPRWRTNGPRKNSSRVVPGRSSFRPIPAATAAEISCRVPLTYRTMWSRVGGGLACGAAAFATATAAAAPPDQPAIMVVDKKVCRKRRTRAPTLGPRSGFGPTRPCLLSFLLLLSLLFHFAFASQRTTGCVPCREVRDGPRRSKVQRRGLL